MRQNHFICMGIIALFLIACNPTNKTEKDTECPPPDPVDTSKLVSKADGKIYYDTYTEGNYVAINEFRASTNNSNPDSRSYWYSIKELESYIHYLKNHPDTQENLDNLGIRFYLGTYPEGTEINGLDASNYQTVFMYPTTENENPFEGNQTSETVEKSGAVIQKTISSLGYNKGKYSPPN